MTDPRVMPNQREYAEAHQEVHKARCDCWTCTHFAASGWFISRPADHVGVKLYNPDEWVSKDWDAYWRIYGGKKS
jgi:hypothetical protein